MSTLLSFIFDYVTLFTRPIRKQGSRWLKEKEGGLHQQLLASNLRRRVFEAQAQRNTMIRVDVLFHIRDKRCYSYFSVGPVTDPAEPDI